MTLLQDVIQGEGGLRVNFQVGIRFDDQMREKVKLKNRKKNAFYLLLSYNSFLKRMKERGLNSSLEVDSLVLPSKTWQSSPQSEFQYSFRKQKFVVCFKQQGNQERNLILTLTLVVDDRFMNRNICFFFSFRSNFDIF